MLSGVQSDGASGGDVAAGARNVAVSASAARRGPIS